MKELEKTKRISIATVLFILVILIGLLAYERPKYMYQSKTKVALEKAVAKDYFVSLEDIKDNPEYVLIDIRDEFEFNKGHLENAVNIMTVDILSDRSLSIFNEIKNDGKTPVLYGKNPMEANTAFLMLSQLDFPSPKILTVENSFSNNTLITNNVEIEKAKNDVQAFIDASVEKAKELSDQKIVVKKTPPKKVITVKKKKKAPTEGGC